MEQLLYFVNEFVAFVNEFVVFIVIWTIGALLVVFDIRHQKKHPPKAPNPKYTKHLES